MPEFHDRIVDVLKGPQSSVLKTLQTCIAEDGLDPSTTNEQGLSVLDFLLQFPFFCDMAECVSFLLSQLFGSCVPIIFIAEYKPFIPARFALINLLASPHIYSHNIGVFEQCLYQICNNTAIPHSSIVSGQRDRQDDQFRTFINYPTPPSLTDLLANHADGEQVYDLNHYLLSIPDNIPDRYEIIKFFVNIIHLILNIHDATNSLNPLWPQTSLQYTLDTDWDTISVATAHNIGTTHFPHHLHQVITRALELTTTNPTISSSSAFRILQFFLSKLRNDTDSDEFTHHHFFLHQVYLCFLITWSPFIRLSTQQKRILTLSLSLTTANDKESLLPLLFEHFVGPMYRSMFLPQFTINEEFLNTHRDVLNSINWLTTTTQTDFKPTVNHILVPQLYNHLTRVHTTDQEVTSQRLGEFSQTLVRTLQLNPAFPTFHNAIRGAIADSFISLQQQYQQLHQDQSQNTNMNDRSPTASHNGEIGDKLDDTLHDIGSLDDIDEGTSLPRISPHIPFSTHFYTFLAHSPLLEPTAIISRLNKLHFDQMPLPVKELHNAMLLTLESVLAANRHFVHHDVHILWMLNQFLEQLCAHNSASNPRLVIPSQELRYRFEIEKQSVISASTTPISTSFRSFQPAISPRPTTSPTITPQMLGDDPLRLIVDPSPSEDLKGGDIAISEDCFFHLFWKAFLSANPVPPKHNSSARDYNPMCTTAPKFQTMNDLYYPISFVSSWLNPFLSVGWIPSTSFLQQVSSIITVTKMSPEGEIHPLQELLLQIFYIIEPIYEFLTLTHPIPSPTEINSLPKPLTPSSTKTTTQNCQTMISSEYSLTPTPPQPQNASTTAKTRSRPSVVPFQSKKPTVIPFMLFLIHNTFVDVPQHCFLRRHLPLLFQFILTALPIPLDFTSISIAKSTIPSPSPSPPPSRRSRHQRPQEQPQQILPNFITLLSGIDEPESLSRLYYPFDCIWASDISLWPSLIPCLLTIVQVYNLQEILPYILNSRPSFFEFHTIHKRQFRLAPLQRYSVSLPETEFTAEIRDVFHLLMCFGGDINYPSGLSLQNEFNLYSPFLQTITRSITPGLILYHKDQDYFQRNAQRNPVLYDYKYSLDWHFREKGGYLRYIHIPYVTEIKPPQKRRHSTTTTSPHLPPLPSPQISTYEMNYGEDDQDGLIRTVEDYFRWRELELRYHNILPNRDFIYSSYSIALYYNTFASTHLSDIATKNPTSKLATIPIPLLLLGQNNSPSIHVLRGESPRSSTTLLDLLKDSSKQSPSGQNLTLEAIPPRQLQHLQPPVSSDNPGQDSIPVRTSFLSNDERLISLSQPAPVPRFTYPFESNPSDLNNPSKCVSKIRAVAATQSEVDYPNARRPSTDHELICQSVIASFWNRARMSFYHSLVHLMSLPNSNPNLCDLDGYYPLQRLLLTSSTDLIDLDIHDRLCELILLLLAHGGANIHVLNYHPFHINPIHDFIYNRLSLSSNSQSPCATLSVLLQHRQSHIYTKYPRQIMEARFQTGLEPVSLHNSSDDDQEGLDCRIFNKYPYPFTALFAEHNPNIVNQSLFEQLYALIIDYQSALPRKLPLHLRMDDISDDDDDDNDDDNNDDDNDDREGITDTREPLLTNPNVVSYGYYKQQLILFDKPHQCYPAPLPTHLDYCCGDLPEFSQPSSAQFSRDKVHLIRPADVMSYLSLLFTNSTHLQRDSSHIEMIGGPYDKKSPDQGLQAIQIAQQPLAKMPFTIHVLLQYTDLDIILNTRSPRQHVKSTSPSSAAAAAAASAASRDTNPTLPSSVLSNGTFLHQLAFEQYNTDLLDSIMIDSLEMLCRRLREE